MIVLDTNIVLDAFLFQDPAAQPLKAALAANNIQWIATPPMREELARVLGYPKIMARLLLCQLTAATCCCSWMAWRSWSRWRPRPA